MKIKSLIRPTMVLNQLILLLIITAFAMTALAATPNTTKKEQVSISKEVKMAKGQPYVPPRKERNNCA